MKGSPSLRCLPRTRPDPLVAAGDGRWRALYLREHDILAPPAQRDAQQVIDGRRILQAHCPVPLLLWCPAQHHIPSGLWGDTV